MRQRLAWVLHRWFAWTMPRNFTTATMSEREQLRKARLLSIGVLAAFLLGLPLLASQLLMANMMYVMVVVTFEGVHVTAALLNRFGRVTQGSWVYILGYVTTATWGLIATGINSGNEMLWGWVQLLIPPIFAGLFLPFWTPLLFSLIDSVIVTVVLRTTPQSAAVLHTMPPVVTIALFTYIYVLMFAVGCICTVSSFSMEHAVAEADRTQELQEAHAALEHAHADLASAYARLEELATIDPVTGLLNHRAMTARMTAEAEHARRNGRNLAVIFADLDHFKRVNDTWGHHAGDQVLSHLALLLQEHVRAADVVARYGGEEFVLLLPGLDHDQGAQMAERLCRIVAATPVALHETFQLDLTISMGLAVFPHDGDTIEDVMIAADAAMYRAKRNGRNRVCTTRDDDDTTSAAA